MKASPSVLKAAIFLIAMIVAVFCLESKSYGQVIITQQRGGLFGLRNRTDVVVGGGVAAPAAVVVRDRGLFGRQNVVVANGVGGCANGQCQITGTSATQYGTQQNVGYGVQQNVGYAVQQNVVRVQKQQVQYVQAAPVQYVQQAPVYVQQQANCVQQVQQNVYAPQVQEEVFQQKTYRRTIR